MNQNSKIKIALVDDHKLFREGLKEMLNSQNNFEVTLDVGDGFEFLKVFEEGQVFDIVVLDINMPKLNGYETLIRIKEKQKSVKVLALSMYEDEYAILNMLRHGASGYILKDSDPNEVVKALNMIHSEGYYSSKLTNDLLIGKLESQNKLSMNERELEFLVLACSEMTYKEIASKMFVSPRTVDGYRDALFQKLKVKSRVGLVLYAIRSGIYLPK